MDVLILLFRAEDEVSCLVVETAGEVVSGILFYFDDCKGVHIEQLVGKHIDQV